MDLGESFGRAVQAARRGDLDALEVELSRLRSLPATNVGSVGLRLRTMARSVRMHPSFTAEPRAEAV